MDLSFSQLLRANSNYCVFLVVQEFLLVGFSCILTWLSSWVGPYLRCSVILIETLICLYPTELFFKSLPLKYITFSLRQRAR